MDFSPLGVLFCASIGVCPCSRPKRGISHPSARLNALLIPLVFAAFDFSLTLADLAITTPNCCRSFLRILPKPLNCNSSISHLLYVLCRIYTFPILCCVTTTISIPFFVTVSRWHKKPQKQVTFISVLSFLYLSHCYQVLLLFLYICTGFRVLAHVHLSLSLPAMRISEALHSCAPNLLTNTGDQKRKEVKPNLPFNGVRLIILD